MKMKNLKYPETGSGRLFLSFRHSFLKTLSYTLFVSLLLSSVTQGHAQTYNRDILSGQPDPVVTQGEKASGGSDITDAAGNNMRAAAASPVSSTPLLFPEFVPISPEAASIAKYLNYPVNHNTGLVDITIPLYEIKVGSLVLPITLSYHASGIKVRDLDGWVAAGWTLNAAPSVSRSVRSLPDEVGYLINRDKYGDSNAYNKMLANGYVEEDPDDFYYRLLDKSGGFMFNRGTNLGTTNFSYTIDSHPYEAIKVTSKIQSNKLLAFTITDENGNFYEFGEYDGTSGTSATEHYQTSTSTTPSVTGWKGLSVTCAKTKQWIGFSYSTAFITEIDTQGEIVVVEDKPGIYGSTHPIACNYPLQYVNSNTQLPLIGFNDSGGGRWAMLSDDGIIRDISCNSMQPPGMFSMNGKQSSRNLQKISFPGGEVLFDSSSIDHFLNSISVYANGSLIRKITFNRTLYTGSDRYKLESIEIRDANNVKVEKYAFEYTGNPPKRNSRYLDLWGYASGTSIPGNTQVPFQFVEAVNSGNRPVSFSIGNSRNANEFFTANGMLTKITYPTGGTTSFTYKANRFLDPEDNSIKTGGGVRIETIADYDPVAGKTINRTFRYGENGCGYGTTKRVIRPTDFVREMDKYYCTTSPGDLTQVRSHVRSRTYGTNLTFDPCFSNGAAVVYSEVTEIIPDKGKTVYRYQPVSTDTYPYNPKMPLEYDSRGGWQHGDLIEKVDHKYENNDSSIVSKQTFRKDPYKWRTKTVRKAIAQGTGDPCGGVDPYAFLGIQTYDVDIVSGCLRTGLETSEMRGANGTVFSSQEYTYDTTYAMPTLINTANSNGETYQTKLLYPYHFTTAPYTNMVAANILSPVVEKYEYKNGSSSPLTYEKAVYGTPYTGMYLPLSRQLKTNKQSSLETRANYTYYPSGNVKEIIRDNAEKAVILWSYNHTYPIAEIKNASYAEVCSALSYSDAQVNGLAASSSPGVASIGATLRGSNVLKNAEVTVYTYQPLVGMKTMTDTRGVVTEYFYDNFGRLVEVRQAGKILQQYNYNYKP